MNLTGILIRFVSLVALTAFIVLLSASGAWAFADGRKGAGAGGLVMVPAAIGVLIGSMSVRDSS